MVVGSAVGEGRTAGGVGRGVSVRRGAGGRLRRGGASSACGAELGGRGPAGERPGEAQRGRQALAPAPRGPAPARSVALPQECAVRRGADARAVARPVRSRSRGGADRGGADRGGVDRRGPGRSGPGPPWSAGSWREWSPGQLCWLEGLFRGGMRGKWPARMTTLDQSSPAVGMCREPRARGARFVGSADAVPDRRPSVSVSASADAWRTDALTAPTCSRAAEHPVQQFRQSLPYGLVVGGARWSAPAAQVNRSPSHQAIRDRVCRSASDDPAAVSSAWSGPRKLLPAVS